jgi:hypothetical protein
MSVYCNAIGQTSTGLGYLNTSGVFIGIPSVAAGNVVTDTGSGATGFVSQAPSTISLPVVNVTTATQTMSLNTRYVVNFASACTLTLPATFAEAGSIIVNNIGAGSIIVLANSGQTITFPGGVTSSGGSLTSTGSGESIVLQATAANTSMQAAPEGVFLKA